VFDLVGRTLGSGAVSRFLVVVVVVVAVVIVIAVVVVVVLLLLLLLLLLKQPMYPCPTPHSPIP
jgi:hypothetical protein